MEREPFELPMKKESSEKDEFIKAMAAKCVAVTKKVAVDALNEKPTDMSCLLFDELSSLWDKAYNKGLKDMERMHNKVDV